MHVDVDWNRVIDVEYNIEGDGVYTICIEFDDNQVCAYGYKDQLDFMKDSTRIINMRGE